MRNFMIQMRYFPTYTLIYEKMLIKMGKFHIYDLICEKQTENDLIFIHVCVYENCHFWTILYMKKVKSG